MSVDEKTIETENRDQRVTILMTKAELAIVDEWRFANRVASRGEAMRQLLLEGIAAREKPAK